MTKNDPKGLDSRTIPDQLYDIAIDPQSLHAFIEAWNDAGLDAQEARRTIENIDHFDWSYQAHLDRAEIFLARAGDASGEPELESTLAPFKSLAAFIVNRDLQIATSNSGAKLAFGIEDGLSVKALNLPR